jgi:dTMP kinase
MQRTRVHPGVLVVLEGVEGSGKSTQARRLARSLESSGCVVVLTHEPGSTELGKKIRKILLDSGSRLADEAELFLYLADRAQHVEEVIIPALEEGSIVICDRFSPSTIAYQGAGRGLGTELVAELCSTAARGIEPNLVVILDLAPDAGLRRLSRTVDRMESEPMEFHERVRGAYLELARQDPHRYVVIDASLPPDEVAREVSSAVRDRLGIPSPAPARR